MSTRVIAIKKITVTYACEHTKVFGVWETPERECWCHAAAVKVEVEDTTFEVKQCVCDHPRVTKGVCECGGIV